MSDRCFVDTNVWVYAHDADEPQKRRRAMELLSSHDKTFVLSTQVLQEFYTVTTRRLARPLTAADARAATARLAALPVVATDTELVLTAVDRAIHSQISLWDALIVEAAIAAGCRLLLTEDLQHGAQLGPVTVENPFLG